MLGQELPCSVPPAAPGLRQGSRIPSHQRKVERIVLREHDRSGVGPMFENFLLVPQELVQVRRPEVADPAPEGEAMRWSNHGDGITLNEAEGAENRTDAVHRSA